MTTPARVGPSEAGTIILFNGTSSSGKTSLAAALRPLLAVQYQHLQLDAFRAMEPPDYWDDCKTRDRRTNALRLAALCRAMNAAVAEYSRHGQNVIFDTELSNRDSMQYVLEDLGTLPVLFVGVFCGVEEAERRELARGDRPRGLARQQYESVHAGKDYDLKIDTTTASAAHCATQVASWLNARPSPRALEGMRARAMAAQRSAATDVPQHARDLGHRATMYHWSVVEDASESDLAVLSDGVVRYGRALAVGGNARPIACLVRDGDKIVAGASGRTEFDRLFVGYLWVDENLRSRGLGSNALRELESAASRRGCVDALIETLNDKAAELYARLGYREIAQIQRYVGSFTKHVLLKPIASDSAACGT